MHKGRRKVISVVAAVGLVAAITAGVTTAATTIAPTYPGNVVRDNNVTITTMPMATTFQRSTATANWTIWNPLVAGSVAGCRGDLGPIGSAGTGNNSPRTTVTVTGPGGITVLDAISPVIDTSVAGLLAGFPPLAVQPAPNTTNYRGVPQATAPTGQPQPPPGATRPFVNTVDLTGKPPGIYTVTTVTRNMVKQGVAACAIGTAVPGTAAAPSTGAAVPGLITDVQTFEYRPWQHVFTDVFAGGKVNMNLLPKEFQAAVGVLPDRVTGSIYSGDATMSLYELPRVEARLMLPTDPAGCANDPSSCLPAGSVQCLPNAEPCDPDIVIINKGAPGDIVQGIFELNTHAFIARVNVEGYQRILLSLGTRLDAAYHDLLARLAAAASAQGIDLMSILATKVRVRLGGNEISLSLLNGLQIQPNAGHPNGVQIVSDFTVQAGLILNIYARLGGTCTATAGDSDPATAAPDRYQHTADVGYTVEKSDLLPDVPRIGAVGALVGGPIYHIEGDFVGSAPALANTSSAVIGVDTAADEPNGYPVWIQPFVSTPSHVTVARTMDFIGTATWSASETPVTGVGCLTVDFMLGAGVALYNNPLDIGFGDIPIWDPQSPAVAALIDQIDAAIQGAVDTVTSNPTVAALLEQITGLLPPLPV